MEILGVETSCDDTCVAILKIENPRLRQGYGGQAKFKIPKIEIISNIVSSQTKLHAKYGGVYPSLAKREHIKNLPKVFKEAFRQAHSKPIDIDLIGVTVGPGLEPCLWQGFNFAKDLAEKLKKPLILVNHIEAHILANWLQIQNTKYKIQDTFPAVCLVVSGGHTQLILMNPVRNHARACAPGGPLGRAISNGVKEFQYRLLGETRDDAAGECFDKVARILGLGYPGGPVVAKMATKIKNQKSKIKNIKLPRPMIYTKDYDFSFSGLKTAVLYEVKKLKTINYKLKTEFCAEAQQAIIDVLIRKTIKATKDYGAKSIILGGGVTANKELRKQFKEKTEKELPQVRLFIPDLKLCTDNGAMIALAAYYNRRNNTPWKEIEVDANLKI